jgi:hypothetical protein
MRRNPQLLANLLVEHPEIHTIIERETAFPVKDGFLLPRYNRTNIAYCPKHGRTCSLTTIPSDDPEMLERWAVCVVMNPDNTPACDFAIMLRTMPRVRRQPTDQERWEKTVKEHAHQERVAAITTAGSIGLGPWMKVSRESWFDLDLEEEDRKVLGPSY